MSTYITRRLIAFAIVLVLPALACAQPDDPDSYPGHPRTGSEPPRLRGGFMQQLRSVTETVLASPSDKHLSQEQNRRAPKPPPTRNGGSEQRSNEFYLQEGRADNRSWAGQFLIPSYRLREQSGPPRSGSQSDRSTAPPRHSLSDDSYPEPERVQGPIAQGPIAQGPRAQGPRAQAAPPTRHLAPTRPQSRVYLGQQRSKNTDEERTDNENADDLSVTGPSRRLPEVVSNVPANIMFVDSEDQTSANQTASSAGEVPYVPRKAVPKRDASKSVASSNKPAAVASKPSPSSAKPDTKSADTDSSATNLRANDSRANEIPQPSLIPPARPQRALPEKLPPALPLEAAQSMSMDPPSLPRTSTSVADPGSSPSIPVPSPGPAILTMPMPPQPATPQFPTTLAPRSSNEKGFAAEIVVEQLPTQSNPAMPPRVQSQMVSVPVASPSNMQERMHMEIPHTVVKLLGPSELTTGSATGYEVVVHNPDRLSLTGLVLRLATPPGVDVIPGQHKAGEIEVEKDAEGGSQMTWSVARIDSGGFARLPVDLKAIAARNFAVSIEWAVLPQEGSSQLVVKQADLQVALEGPVEVEKNTAGAYRLRVSNPGNAPARNVKVFVSAAGQQASQVDLGELAAGKYEVIEMDLTFEKAGRVEIAAHADAVGVAKRTANISVNVRQAILQSKLLLPSNAPHGSTLVATIEVKNVGDGVAHKLESGLLIPDNAQVINMPAGITRQGNKLLWEVEQVPPGQLINVPIELQFSSPGENELKFACTSLNGASTMASAMTMVEAFSDLKLYVNDPPAPAPIGQPVTYEISITNRGSRDARDVSIVAQFSEGIEPKNAKGLQHRLVPGQVLFETIPTIAAGETVKLQIVAQASVSGMHRFRAEVRCEESDMRLVEEESTRFLESVGRIASPPSSSIQR